MDTLTAGKGNSRKHSEESGATFSICLQNHDESNCQMAKQSHVFPSGENFPNPDRA